MTMIWRDLGLVFDINKLKSRPHWYISHAQAPNSVVFEDFVRVYFTARGESDSFGNVLSRVMYVDLDPAQDFKIINLSSEPILDLGNLGEFDEHGTYPFSVLRRERDFIAIYGGWSRTVSVPFDISLGLAVSSDGRKFERFARGPVLAPTLAEPFVITSPKLRKFNDEYFLTYTAGIKWIETNEKPEIVYKLRSARSKDLINWERNGKNLLPDHLGEFEAQACGDIILTSSGYHMFFCYREALDFRRNVNNSYRIGYAYSQDLNHWERKDEKINIQRIVGAWNYEMCAYPNVFEYSGKTYMLYLGNGTGKEGFGASVLESKTL